MAKVNKNKLLEKMKEMKERANSMNRERARIFTPKVGDNRLRIMPPWTDEGPNEGQFWREILTHWNVGEGGYDEESGRPFTCPLKTPDGPGDSCAVCEFVKKLRNTGEPADVEIAKQIGARRHYYMNVVDLKDPVFTEDDIEEYKAENDKDPSFEEGDTKVQVWKTSEQHFKSLLDVMADGVDFTDLEDGHDVIVTREGKGKTTTRYRVRVDPKSSSFEFIGEFKDLVVNLDEIFPFPKEEDMLRALNGDSRSFFPKDEAPKLKSGPSDSKEVQVEDMEEPPNCFKDLETQSDDDAMCVGGMADDGEEYDPCPFLDPCREAKLKAEESKKKASRRRRRSSKNSSSDKSTTSVDDLEKELMEAVSD